MLTAAAARVATASNLVLALAACTAMGNSTQSASSASAASGTSGLTAEQTAAGWHPLFDGTNTNAWRGYKTQTMPAGWRIVDGILTQTGPVEDLISKDQFANFELAMEWKLSPGGNAGLFYRGTEEYDHIYWSAPEYQLLDDAGHPDGKSRLTSAGSDYGRSEEHTSELQSPCNLVCRLLLETKTLSDYQVQ